jgi:hypothetical protein
LISTSKNYKAAKLLALRRPECTVSLSSPPVPRDLPLIAPRISAAYLQRSAGAVDEYKDPDRLIAESTPRDSLQVSEIKDCGFWGSERLSFVPMSLSYESAKTIGWIDVLLILRKRQARWQLLAGSTDPISTNQFLSQIPQLANALKKPGNPGKQPTPAILISPDGQVPPPAGGQRFGNFVWKPSPSGDVVAEIAEFAYQDNARLFLRLRSSAVTSDQVSAGELWTTGSQWRWRIWSISNASDVSFSQVRSFPH